MGNVKSDLTKQTLADYTQVINDTVENVFGTVIQRCTEGSTFNFVTGQNCPYLSTNGTLNPSQRALSSCTFGSNYLTPLIPNFQQSIQVATQNFIEQEMKKQPSWFNTAFSLSSNKGQNSSTVSNIIAGSFSGNFTNKCPATANALNNITLNLCGAYDVAKFNFNQNALTTALTSCANEIILNTFNTNPTLKTLWTTTDQHLNNPHISSFWWYIIIIFLGIILLIIVIVIIVKLIEGHSNETLNLPKIQPSSQIKNQ